MTHSNAKDSLINNSMASPAIHPIIIDANQRGSELAEEYQRLEMLSLGTQFTNEERERKFWTVAETNDPRLTFQGAEKAIRVMVQHLLRVKHVPRYWLNRAGLPIPDSEPSSKMNLQ